MSDWANQPNNIDEWYGFVYVILNTTNNKFYIGKKQFWFEKTLPPLKGKKQKRHKRIESDWKDYYGSCRELQEDIEKLGKDKFVRRIIHLCKNKWDMSYLELYEQMQHRVLYNEQSYNGIINVRLRKRKTINVEAK